MRNVTMQKEKHVYCFKDTDVDWSIKVSTLGY